MEKDETRKKFLFARLQGVLWRTRAADVGENYLSSGRRDRLSMANKAIYDAAENERRLEREIERITVRRVQLLVNAEEGNPGYTVVQAQGGSYDRASLTVIAHDRVRNESLL